MNTTLIPPNHAAKLQDFYTWMAEDGICRTVAKPGAEITITSASENSLIINAFQSAKKFPLLVDSRNIKSITREARSHFSTNGRETKINCIALMVKSPLSRVIGNFFLGLNKPSVPSRLFEEESDAINWVKQFV